eukprot:146220_1
MFTMRQIVIQLVFVVVIICCHGKPNIVFILTDDQDITLDGMKYMSKTNKIIVENGIEFTNAFVSTPICCVSRASILSGRYVHNHGTINNSFQGGCFGKNWQNNIEPNCFSTYIKSYGYTTFYAGKYLNVYGNEQFDTGGVEHVPEGWDYWYGLVGNAKYYDYTISDNGKYVHYEHNYSNGDYYTNVIHKQSVNFLINNYYYNKKNSNPFFMVIAVPASHAPFTTEPKYENTANNGVAPRIPSWNNVNKNVISNKHDIISKYHNKKMGKDAINICDKFWRMRHGTLQTVDDIIFDIYNIIDKKLNLIENTYFIYLSDHGFHIGQFGMGWDKRQPYETDIRIPFYIMGPNIEKNIKTDIIALNIDIAPTLIELTGNKIPKHMDGKSLIKYIFNDKYYYKKNDKRNKNNLNLKQQFLIEYYGDAFDGIRICDMHLG